MTQADSDDGLKQRFGSGPSQDDLEARHWRGTVAARLFGRSEAPVSIGRFQVLSRVGSGGAGVVYSAWDPKLERRVAVKVLRGAHDPREVEREAKLLAKLSHPNVVGVYDVGEHEGGAFLAMEFVDGRTLLDAEVAEWKEALALLRQAAAGLQAAHDVGVVHGDVKPTNMLVGVDGRLRVTDFGTAHAGDQQLLGATPAYMAPEQARGQAATARSDQFSLCATAFELFYGVRPFAGTSADAVRTALLEGTRHEPPQPTRIPRWLRDSLERGLSTDPAQRHADLRSLLATWRRGGRSRVGPGTAGVLALATVAAAAASQSGAGVDPCGEARDRIVSLWSPTRKQGLSAQFQSHGQTFAAQTWSRVESELDGHIEQLQDVLTQACAHPNEEASLRRRLCVERRIIEVGALLDVLETDDPAVVEESVLALSLLTDPQGCVLDARPSEAPDEAERRAILESVARARALRGVGKLDEALGTLKRARRDAHDVRDPAVTARILLELGDTFVLLEGVSEDTPTLATLEAALLAADAADAPHLTAQALLSLANANHRATRFEEALRWLDRLDDHLQGFDAPRLKGRSAILRALVGSMVGGWEDEAATRKALRRLRESGARDTWLALGLNNLGEVEFEKRDDESAKRHYEQALEIWNDVLGPSHPTTAGARGNLGEIALFRGEFETALAHFLNALEIRSAAWGPDSFWVAHTQAHIADVHRLEGRSDEAEAIYREVLTFTRRELPLPDSEVFFALDTGVDQLQPWALHGLALIELERGDPEAALAWASQVDANTEIRAERHPDLSARFDVMALALTQLGRFNEAAVVLDRFERTWARAYANGVYKGVYAPLARAELALRQGRPEDACARLLPTLALDDPGLPAEDRRRLDTAAQSCETSQVR